MIKAENDWRAGVLKWQCSANCHLLSFFHSLVTRCGSKTKQHVGNINLNKFGSADDSPMSYPNLVPVAALYSEKRTLEYSPLKNGREHLLNH